MKYFSMFSGIGGFELGIQRAVGMQSKATELQMESNICGDNSDIIQRASSCVGFSEIDKYAIKIYESHFGGHKNYGDATRIVPEELPDFDLLVGGFPCQAFSIAGKRLGFDDTRGTLFFDIARILKVKRPRNFLLENVKGLLSHDSGRTFKIIISTLAELGYSVEWQVLNSKDFGVPQNRERVFIVGHLGGFGGREVFPIGEGNGSNCEELTHNTNQANRVYSINGLSPTMPTSGVGRHEPKIIDPSYMRLEGKCRVYDEAPTLNKRDYKEPRCTITKDMRIRRLTPTECERLQGFPDGWTVGISDSQRYKCLGNAVTVNVIEAVVSRLIGQI